jgi:hypothetical protein
LDVPTLVGALGGRRTRARLRPSERDAVILGVLAGSLAKLTAQDLARRCRLGVAQTSEEFNARRNALTALTSARIASTIVRGNEAQWQPARRERTRKRRRSSARRRPKPSTPSISKPERARSGKPVC